MVVTESERVGSFLGHPIFKVTTLKVLPCDHSLKNSPEEQVNSVVSSFLWNILVVMMDLKISKNCVLFPAEKDGDRVLQALKCSRKDNWSLFLI